MPKDDTLEPEARGLIYLEIAFIIIPGYLFNIIL